ncbi:MULTISPECIES: ABC transporter permease [Roseobacteraceae]|uniref:Glutathione transport system permease protein GsiD n=1 Tax=Pseudosulfitobacter pseudonitzschiae TaxID=1402135 RepID=A0A221K7N5_9RHOB|nr:MULTISPECIES: ABC transporter permease [Roseobacteraceae]ASM74985.1 glutathione transport system permease protein GsiD [Pseudosulfitobacter pseudonitzschiae]
MVDTSVAENPSLRGAATSGPTDHATAIARHKKGHRLGLGFWLPGLWLVLVVVLAVLAPVLGLPLPDEIDWAALLQAPDANHPFGTDPLGRDLLSRVIYGARVSLTVGFAAPAIGVGLGLVLGLAAGFYRGWVDEIIGIAIDSWLAIPGLVVLLLFSVLFGGSLGMVCLSLGLLFIPSAARIARAATMNVAGRDFVLAARAQGASDLRIITREIFPNIIWPLIAFVLIDIPIAIVAEGALSFLGLSVQAPTASWGGIISEGREYLETAPHISLIPTAVMFLTVLSFNLVGDALRRRLSGARAGAI